MKAIKLLFFLPLACLGGVALTLTSCSKNETKYASLGETTYAIDCESVNDAKQILIIAKLHLWDQTDSFMTADEVYANINKESNLSAFLYWDIVASIANEIVCTNSNPHFEINFGNNECQLIRGNKLFKYDTNQFSLKNIEHFRIVYKNLNGIEMHPKISYSINDSKINMVIKFSTSTLNVQSFAFINAKVTPST